MPTVAEPQGLAAAPHDSASHDARVERCLDDLTADHARQGGLTRDDVVRLLDAHALEPSEVVEVLKGLSARGIEVDDPQSGDDDEDGTLAKGEASAFLDIGRRNSLLTAEDEVRLGRRIRLGQEAVESGKSGKERQRLILDGKQARDELVLANLRLVYSIARRCMGRGLDLEDLLHEGVVGLMTAADKFDYTLGYKFSTYATWWIRQSIDRGIGNTARAIRIPIHQLEFIKRVIGVRRQLEHRDGHVPGLHDLATELSEHPSKVQAALDQHQGVVSLDSFASGHEFSLTDVLQDRLPLPDRAVEARLMRAVMYRRLSEWADRYPGRISPLDILRRRLGFSQDFVDDERMWTLDEIGREFGVTRERIRQIEKKALGSLQVVLADLAPIKREADAD